MKNRSPYARAGVLGMVACAAGPRAADKGVAGSCVVGLTAIEEVPLFNAEDGGCKNGDEVADIGVGKFEIC